MAIRAQTEIEVTAVERSYWNGSKLLSSFRLNHDAARDQLPGNIEESRAAAPGAYNECKTITLLVGRYRTQPGRRKGPLGHFART
jgi:hypothetical protein